MSWDKPSPRSKKWEGSNMPTPRAPALIIPDGKARMVVPVPKEAPERSETYRRWVAAKPCEHCGRDGPNQAAHSDLGKGLGIKASDKEVFSLCADFPGGRGCHSLMGSSGLLGKEHRRALERRYVLQTQMAAKSCGAWPKEWA